MREEWKRLSGLYRELEAELARRGAACRGCGECCRFDRADHVLYASDLERGYLLHTAPLPPAPEADADLLARGLRCPFQIGGGCTAREGRVLGCRLYFCEGADGPDGQEFCEDWHERLKKLHGDLDVAWNYRPLLPI